MAKYNMIPNKNYGATSFFNSLNLHRIEKIIWCKNVGEYLHPGEILCIIHFNDYIFEMECVGGDYLLYKNSKTEVSFSHILSISGKLHEDVQSIFNKHNEDLRNYDTTNDPLFQKLFEIENSFAKCESSFID